MAVNWKELKRRRQGYYHGETYRYGSSRRRRREWKPWYIWIFTNRYAGQNILIALALLAGLLHYAGLF